MRFVGIDIGSERHSVAIVDEGGRVVSKSVSFEEGAAGSGGSANCSARPPTV
jgi:transposase